MLAVLTFCASAKRIQLPQTVIRSPGDELLQLARLPKRKRHTLGTRLMSISLLIDLGIVERYGVPPYCTAYEWVVHGFCCAGLVGVRSNVCLSNMRC